MANITWRTVAKSINDDAQIMASLVESAQAPEKVAIAPAAVYLRMHADIGDAGFAVLPEPNSNQEKKVDGLGFHIGDNKRAEMDADPTRHWDKYFYKHPNTGETVQGSVYVDMVKDTAIGKTYYDAGEVLKAWNGKEVKPETLQQTVTIDGETLNCSMMTNKQRGDMAGMLNGRILNMASALRRVVGIWRMKKDIEARLSEYAKVTFVFNKRDDPSSGLAKGKKPILLLELNSNKLSEDYGQRTGFAETFTPTIFNQLDVDKAVAAPANANKYQVLKDSRKERATTKPGAGKSTQEKGKATIESRVSSNNLLVVMSNIRVFTEEEDSKRHTFNRLAAMKKDDREELIASILQFRDWSADFDTPDNRAIARAYESNATERARDALAAKSAADAMTAEAEAQPSQHARNAMREEQGENVDAARERAEKANKPTSGRSTASVSGRRKAN